MAGDLVKKLCTARRKCPFSTELIIVTDYSATHLQSLYPECLWLYIPDRSISRKRNCGIYVARGSLCAFIDDDCIPDDHWLEEGGAYLHNHPEAAAVEGYTTIEKRPDVPEQLLREYRRLERPGFRTNNLFFRTAILKTLDGFDERFTVQREDMDLAFSALSRGYAIHYHKAQRVTHRYRTGEPWDLLKNCWNRRFDPLLYKKHTSLYRKHIGSPIPRSQKIALLFAAVAVLGVLLTRKHHRTAAAAAVLFTATPGIRRAEHTPSGSINALLQSLAAPWITLFALIYGSVRYGKFLLF